jgi:cell division protein FtsZ
LEEEVEAPKFEIHTPVAPAMDLVPTSELIKNIDVRFEVISSNVAPSFEIITPQIREIEVKEPEFIVAKDDFNFSFDLFETKPAESKTQNQIVFELTEETREMEVNEPINVIPVTEVNQSGIVRYSLEDYFDKEAELEVEKPVAKMQEAVDEELNFTMKKSADESISNTRFSEVSPLEMSIEESLKFRAEERKRKMKDFNHKFNNINAHIDEIEKEPAYKRMGIDVTSTPNTNSNQSRMSLGVDSNDDLQLRSNNSFLHDNVD